MEAFFADNTFFVYLMKQAYDIWVEFYLYIPSLPDDRLVYLYTPYEFVSRKHIDKPSFFKEWLTINANKEIVLTGKGTYHTKVTYHNAERIDKLEAYHTINGKEIGYKHTESWYPYLSFRWEGRTS